MSRSPPHPGAGAANGVSRGRGFRRRRRLDARLPLGFWGSGRHRGRRWVRGPRRGLVWGAQPGCAPREALDAGVGAGSGAWGPGLRGAGAARPPRAPCSSEAARRGERGGVGGTPLLDGWALPAARGCRKGCPEAVTTGTRVVGHAGSAPAGTQCRAAAWREPLPCPPGPGSASLATRRRKLTPLSLVNLSRPS